MKLKGLILLNIFLVVAIGLSLWDGPVSTNTTEVSDLERWMPRDTSAIQSIQIEGVTLQHQKSGWILEATQQAINPLKINSTLYILTQWQERLLSPEHKEEALTRLQQNGLTVSIKGEKGTETYQVVQKDERTLWLGKNDTAVKEISIGGNQLKLEQIFSTSAHYWQDRRVLPTNWGSMKELAVRYSGAASQNDYHIAYNPESRFYQVKQVEQLDSLMLYEYVRGLQLLEYEKAVERTSLKDSLRNYTPFSTLYLEDLYSGKRTLKVYPMGPQEVYVWEEEKGQVMEVNFQQMQDVLVVPSLFDATVEKGNR
ncbi:hypothetical protein [Algivirga pacifica]|uniref:DUF4340 domain-containing protein n=1 Tax=Algivirga pacifica TaxID=1162670 RepID=A0ABP9D9H3_9BACT